MESKPKYSYHARIHIRDELSGSALLVNCNANGSTKKELIASIDKECKKYVVQIRDLKDKDIKEIIKSKKEDGWSNRRIRNHFAKFGIEVLSIDLPEEKKKRKSDLPDSQKKLFEGT
jgi:hypothetical protein